MRHRNLLWAGRIAFSLRGPLRGVSHQASEADFRVTKLALDHSKFHPSHWRDDQDIRQINSLFLIQPIAECCYPPRTNLRNVLHFFRKIPTRFLIAFLKRFETLFISGFFISSSVHDADENI